MKNILFLVILSVFLCGCSNTKQLSSAIDEFQSECAKSGGKLSSEFYENGLWASLRIKCDNYSIK